MSVNTQNRPPTQPGVDLVSVEAELAQVLHLEEGSTVTGFNALIREDYTTTGRRLPSGALVIRCEVDGVTIPGKHELTVDDNSKNELGISEGTLAIAGLSALEKRDAGKRAPLNKWGGSKGDYIHNVVC